MKSLVFALGLIVGMILIADGAYYLFSQSPILLHSYTLQSILYVVAGLMLMTATFIDLYDRRTFQFTSRGLWLFVLSVIFLVGGYGYYRYYTSQVNVQQPIRQEGNKSVIAANTDQWTSPEIKLKPDQNILVYSREPFHVSLGDVQAEASPNSEGVYVFEILTTNIDYSATEDYSGVTQLTANDSLKVRLTQEATATTAEVFVKLTEHNNNEFVEQSRSNYFWSRMVLIGGGGFVVIGLFISCLLISPLVLAKIEEMNEEKKIRAEKEAADKEAERLEEEAALQWGRQEAERRRAEELCKRQDEFARKVADIDPATLFED